MKKTALISVQNKNNLKSICKIFKEYDIEIISTGGTYDKIQSLGYSVKKIQNITNFKEILEGKVKTLHPKIHGGILFNRNNQKHKNLLKKQKIPNVDFVIVDLYPFKKTVDSKKSHEECINNIDIGGHTLIRSAAKNYEYVTVVCETKDYKKLYNELKRNKGKTSITFRKMLAKKAFNKILKYNYEINKWFQGQTLLNKDQSKIQLRYGENPHQKAFVNLINKNNNFSNFKKLYGKELSYNNINDINCAISCLKDFKKPCSVIIKHANPCGVACGKNIYSAFVKSLECDKKSAFGGIVALNKYVNEKIAIQVNKIHIDIIIAPNFSSKALKILKTKNLIILKSLNKDKINKFKEIKSISGGYLVQDYNNLTIQSKKLKCVTKNKVSKKILNDMIFAFIVCKHLKSNAIVLAKDQQVIGIGAGETSRIDSINIALNKMKKNFNKNINFILASDGFLPFEDNVSALKKDKCRGIIQPGGSKSDKKIIKIAESLKISMYFTGIRHFKH